MGHEIIVIGASAGGHSALASLLAQLPFGFQAAVFIVVHRSAELPCRLAEVLDRASFLPVKLAENGDDVRHGRVLVAPPDHHLLLRPGHVQLSRGEREHGCRPAVDPLFRSAATAFASRVVGIVLSGGGDDGAEGLLAIRRAGGIAISQAPQDAEFPWMPVNAIKKADVDYCLPVAEMGNVLERLVQGIGAGSAVGTSGRQMARIAFPVSNSMDDSCHETAQSPG